MSGLKEKDKTEVLNISSMLSNLTYETPNELAKLFIPQLFCVLPLIFFLRDTSFQIDTCSGGGTLSGSDSDRSLSSSLSSSDGSTGLCGLAGVFLEAAGGLAVILSLANASLLLGGVTDTTLSSSSPSSSSSSSYAGFSLTRKNTNSTSPK